MRPRCRINDGTGAHRGTNRRGNGKADARVCVGSDRCYALPHWLEDARGTCTPKGQCKVGWILRMSGHESWDVWLEVRTGLVKLVPQTDA